MEYNGESLEKKVDALQSSLAKNTGNACLDRWDEATGFIRPVVVKPSLSIAKGASTFLMSPSIQTSSQRCEYQAPVEAEAAKSQSRLYFLPPKSKKPCWLEWLLLKKSWKSMIPAQDQVNEQLNQLTALLKALDGQAEFNKRKRSLSALTTEVRLLASKPNHPSGEALQWFGWWSVNEKRKSKTR